VSARTTVAVALFGGLPFLYVAGVGLADLTPGEVPLAFLGFALVGLFSLVFLLEPRRGPWIGGAGTLVLLAVLCVAAVAPGPPGSPTDEIAWGVMLAAPLLFLLHLVRTQESPGLRLVGLQLGLADGLLLLATPSSLGGAGGGFDAAVLLRGFFRTLDQQLVGIARLAAGQNALVPLRNVSDPWFVGLGGLAVLVTFLTFLRPSTGRSVGLPTYAGPAPGAEASADELATVTPRFRALLEQRSGPRGAPPGRYPGAFALLAAGVAGAALLGLSVLGPAAVLPVVAGGVVALLAASAAVLRRPIS
jgi:hypothetical protein